MDNRNVILEDQSFEGIIDKGEIANDLECKYPVYIPKLMANTKNGYIPIWAKNEIDQKKYSRWIDPTTEEVQSAGTYTPLSYGMRVNVKFRSNSMSSAYITHIKSSVAKIVSRDDYYLINKTVKDSYIYQDDYRSVTGIIHSGGKTNLTLDDSKISMSVCKQVDNVGQVTINGMEVDKLGTKFRYKNSSIVLDDTGITFKVGESKIVINESGFQFISPDKLDFITEGRLNIKGNDVRITGIEKLDLYSNITRMTGAQMMNITGSVVSMDSTTSTHIKSTKHLVLESLMEAKISSSTLEIQALLNMNITSINTAVAGVASLVLSGSNTAIDSVSLSMDGQIMHNMGLATSTAKAIIASNTALALGMQGAGIAESTILGINAMPMGVVANAMMETLTGTAKIVGNTTKTFECSLTASSDIEQKNIYIQESDTALNYKVKDQFYELRNAHAII